MELSYGYPEMKYLSASDPVLQRLIDKYGKIIITTSDDYFADIVENIASQQLSLKAATTIINRLRHKAGKLTPDSLSALSLAVMRTCGLSSAKASYISLFSYNVRDGMIDLTHLHILSDEELIEYLTRIKGIGVWTAEMVALFSIGRKNIFSFSDIALKNGIMSAHGYKSLSKMRFEKLRKIYSPYCSIASLYYYRCNDEKRS
jgi:DNA-3-methyladenine glycosylase II